MTSDTRSLVATIGFDLIGSDLGKDVESALRTALSGGAIFADGGDALAIFRQALASSIRNIESHPWGKLIQEFLRKGPYENVGEIPTCVANQRLTDDDWATAITFVYSHMVNSFKGAVTELLSVRACLQVLTRLKQDDQLPQNARLYVGDSVRVQRTKGKGFLKGADFYILIEENKPETSRSITVAGVIEVKSYYQSERRLRKQLDQHLQRAQQGLEVSGVDYHAENIKVGYGRERRVIRIAILPSTWKLPRSFRYEDSEHGRVLHVDEGEPPTKDDKITQIGESEWRITLRWSKEAIAQAAYEMTFWYMEKVGETIYSDPDVLPKEWQEMTPAEVGRNVAKMMLYYSILRCRTQREYQRAIALYNAYGFGYALGMSFRNPEGKREMLWPQDLDEILATGKTKSLCTLR